MHEPEPSCDGNTLDFKPGANPVVVPKPGAIGWTSPTEMSVSRCPDIVGPRLRRARLGRRGSTRVHRATKEWTYLRHRCCFRYFLTTAPGTLCRSTWSRFSSYSPVGLSASPLCLWSAVPNYSPSGCFLTLVLLLVRFLGSFTSCAVFLTLTVRSAFCLHLDYTVVKKFTGKRRVSLSTFAFRFARRCEGLWWLSSFILGRCRC